MPRRRKDMAKTKEATKTTASGKAKPAAGKKSGTSTATGGLDELSALANSTKELEDAQRLTEGGQGTYIKLVTSQSGEVDVNSPAFMKGVKPLDYVISSRRMVVSDKKQCVDATVIGMFKVYAEKAKKESDNDMAKTVKFWLPEEAVQYPTVAGSNFERELPDGNVLVPAHWVFLYLHNHPDVTDGRIIFQSKGNAVYAELAKMMKAESSVCTELRFKISNQNEYNDKYKKTYYYPKFEIAGHNYKLVDGKVTKTKDSDVDAATLKEILTRSDQLYKDFAAFKIVSKQAALPAPAVRAALPAGKGAYVDDDDGDENVTF